MLIRWHDVAACDMHDAFETRKVQEIFDSPCLITLVDLFLIAPTLVALDTKLCNMNAFAVRKQLEPDSNIIRNSSVVEFKAPSSLE